MPGAKHLPAYARVQLPSWYYIGGETLTNPNNQALTLPSTVDTIVISMESGDGYYAINGAASTSSDGYIPENGFQSIGPVANLTSVNVHAPSGVVHVEYWREA